MRSRTNAERGIEPTTEVGNNGAVTVSLLNLLYQRTRIIRGLLPPHPYPPHEPPGTSNIQHPIRMIRQPADDNSPLSFGERAGVGEADARRMRCGAVAPSGRPLPQVRIVKLRDS